MEEIQGKLSKLSPCPMSTHLFIDLFSTISTLDHTLDDVITAEVVVQPSQSVQRHSEADEVDGLVEKDAVRHYHGAIVLCLLDCVVPAPLLVVWPRLQHGEFEVQIGVEGQDYGEGWEDDVGDEGGHDVGKGRGNSAVGDGLACLAVVLFSPFFFSFLFIPSKIDSP